MRPAALGVPCARLHKPEHATQRQNASGLRTMQAVSCKAAKARGYRASFSSVDSSTSIVSATVTGIPRDECMNERR